MTTTELGPAPRPSRARAVFDRVRARAVAASLRLAPSEPQRIFALTILLGVACGLVAVAFHEAIRGAQALLIDRALVGGPSTAIVVLLVVPAAGGLCAGAFLHWVMPTAAGSGIPQVKTAYALDTSGARLRDAVGKFVVCVLQLGSGASLGREGPTVQICAGLATSLSRWLALSPANLRRLIPVGAAAGVAAAFNAPIAAVTFTIEEIVGTLDQTVLSGVVVAAALAAVVEHSILGENPVLHAPVGAGLHHASSLPFYALLGACAAFASIAFTDLLLSVRTWARKPGPVPMWARPGVGGLVTGLLAIVAVLLVDEQGIAGGGYATLTDALSGRLALHVLALLAVLKLLATVSSYASGGAGGIFAPTLFVGAMLGGLVGGLDVAVLGHVPQEEMTSFALVGMGAVFAGVIRAPITSVLIVFEMTGGYGLVLPLMIANSVAYVVARRLRPTPIYEALLAQDGIVLPHGTVMRASLQSIPVRAAMTTALETMAASLRVSEAASIAARHGHATYPVLDEGRFIGLMSEARIQRTLAEGKGDVPIGTVARRKEYCTPEEPLLRAVTRMTRLGVRQLPVLDAQTHALVGLLAASDVLRAQVRAEASASSSADRSSELPVLVEPAAREPPASP
ncbi:MAG: chloride channel protein [Sandaracinus sp.]